MASEGSKDLARKGRPTSSPIMWQRLITLDPKNYISLQAQLREQMVKAILDRALPLDKPLPSPRKLSDSLGIARTTVVLAYQRLVDEQFLIARERRGYFINAAVLQSRSMQKTDRLPSPVAVTGSSYKSSSPYSQEGTDTQKSTADNAEWSKTPVTVFSVLKQRNIYRPHNWFDYDYPFIYGQIDPSLFPVNDWREASRLSLHVGAIDRWSNDSVDNDDEQLVNEILTKVLPRRGVWASADEVLVTVGAQNGLYMVAQLLLDRHRTVGIEDPCYPDARNMFSIFTNRMETFDVGPEGVQIDERFKTCDLMYVTPSHQCPTTITLPLNKRRELLAEAMAHNVTIIEDDYESELNFVDNPTPALKSLDTGNVVIYTGSLSKTLAPGLRVGFIVAPAPFIEEVRALRRLMYRHPPTNNQRTVAHFLQLGHYDAAQVRLDKELYRRWSTMKRCLQEHSVLSSVTPTFGGSSYWVCLPETVNATELESRAANEGIILSAGGQYYHLPEEHTNCCRLGFSSIADDRIEPGLYKLAQLISTLEKS